MKEAKQVETGSDQPVQTKDEIIEIENKATVTGSAIWPGKEVAQDIRYTPVIGKGGRVQLADRVVRQNHI